MSSSDLLINAGGCVVLAFGVSLAVSLLRSPKLLDDLRISEKNHLISLHGGEMTVSVRATPSINEAGKA
jgi:hypothetical protein